MKSIICLTTCVAVLLLAGCSDDDDGEVLPGDGAGETSEPAPDSDVPENPLSSTPGGDTSAIAGLWNASSGATGQFDERYVQITADGLYTEFDYRQDDLADDGNCYLSYGPLTLTPEDPANMIYSLPDDRFFNATRNADNTVLSVTFNEQDQQEWTSVTGISAQDLPGCANIQE